MKISKSNYLLSMLSGLVLWLGFSAIASAQNANPLPERSLGEASAKVVIHEFASLTCVHCAEFHEKTFPLIEKNYIDTGKVRIVYHDFPLDSRAEVAALLARCVPEEIYFNFIHTLYFQRDLWIYEEQFIDKMTRYGKFAGLNQNEIEACFQNQDLYASILRGKDEAASLHNINSTPSFLINDKLIEGSLGYEEFAKLIDAALEE